MLRTRPQPATEATVLVGGRVVSYTVRRSAAAKRARIEVGPAGVVVVLPRSKADGFAAEFVLENREWLLAQLDATAGIRRKQNAVTKSPSIWFRGERCPVTIQHRDDGPIRPAVFAGEAGISVCLRLGGDADAAVERWLRMQARPLFEERIARFARLLRVVPGRLFVRGQRTKWGNCSAAGNISLNWRLTLAPPATLDAVVLHELAHLREPTHQTKFWLLLRSHCSDYYQRMRWLADHEAELFAPLAGGCENPIA